MKLKQLVTHCKFIRDNMKKCRQCFTIQDRCWLKIILIHSSNGIKSDIITGVIWSKPQ